MRVLSRASLNYDEVMGIKVIFKTNAAIKPEDIWNKIKYNAVNEKPLFSEDGSLMVYLYEKEPANNVRDYFRSVYGIRSISLKTEKDIPFCEVIPNFKSIWEKANPSGKSNFKSGKFGDLRVPTFGTLDSGN